MHGTGRQLVHIRDLGIEAGRAHDPALFGKRGYAVFFFANYMNDVEQVALNFLGHERAGDAEHWIEADARSGHPDYNGGDTYRHAAAPAIEYDADHDFKLNLWSYDWPRYTKPFYFGRAAHGMTLVMMFDKAYNDIDEIRLSLFKFKIPKFPRPALDWQYVIHRVEGGREYGFRGRLVWSRAVARALPPGVSELAAMAASRPATGIRGPGVVAPGCSADRS